jgi:hypothetical protein
MAVTFDLDSELDELWQMCVDAFARHNIVLRFPKDTNRKNTYQWRYLKAMHSDFVKWRLTKQEIPPYLKIAVDYAKQHGLTRKGMAFFQQSNIRQLCLDIFKQQQTQRTMTLKSLRSMAKWFDVQTAGKDPVEVCLERSVRGSLCNITKWYQSSKISALFMALNKSCMIALDMVGDDDRSFLPKKTELVLIRQDFRSSMK